MIINNLDVVFLKYSKFYMVVPKVYQQGLLLAKITAGFEINFKMNIIYNRYISMR